MYRCLTRRGVELFELTDALLCAEGPVKSLVGLCLAPEDRRGHGALYDALHCGRVDAGRLREALMGLPLPRMLGGRIVLAVDVSPWLRPDAPTAPDRLFCHVYGRGRGPTPPAGQPARTGTGTTGASQSTWWARTQACGS